MAQKIWVVSELYYPEETSTGFFITKIAEGLATQQAVAALCSQPTYSARGIVAPTHETLNGVEVWRCPSTRLNKDMFLFRLINLITISLSIFITALLEISSFDRVLVVTNPPLLPFLIAFVCHLKRARCILLVHDVYPDVLVVTGIIRKDSLTANLIQFLTRQLYREMDRIVVIGRDMQNLVSQKLGDAVQKIILIPNWGDTEVIIPEDRYANRLLQELNLVDKFVVQYAGNMGRTHGLEDLIECACQLRNHKNIHFLVIGSGAKKRWFQEQVQNKQLQNVTVLNTRPGEDRANFLNACDIAIISFIKDMAGISVPSRMYNVFAAGKPLIAIAEDNSELAMVTYAEKIGWVIHPGQPEQIIRVILEAQSNPKALSEMALRSRAVAEQKYTYRNVINEYLALFQELE